jgi:cell division protein FtsB
VQEQIQKIINKIPYKRFQDVRAVGLVVFGLIVLMITWSGVRAIQTNYNLQKQISQLSQENSNQQLENKNLVLENQYYNTNQYLQLQAMALLGKGEPGETLILVSKTAAYAQLAPGADITPKASTITQKPKYQQNFEAWIAFYFHRDN